MNTLQTTFVLAVATIGSFSLALLVQWLALRALFLVLPGRRRLTAAQAALIHTRRVVMAGRITDSPVTSHQSLATGASH